VSALEQYRPEFLEAYRATCPLAARVLAQDSGTMLKQLETILQRKNV
jgi:hypothetical protein